MPRSTRTLRPGSGPSTTSCRLSSDRRNACARPLTHGGGAGLRHASTTSPDLANRGSLAVAGVEFCVRVGTGIPGEPLLPGGSDSRRGRNRRTPSPSTPATPATTRRALAFTSCRTLGGDAPLTRLRSSAAAAIAADPDARFVAKAIVRPGTCRAWSDRRPETRWPRRAGLFRRRGRFSPPNESRDPRRAAGSGCKEKPAARDSERPRVLSFRGSSTDADRPLMSICLLAGG